MKYRKLLQIACASATTSIINANANTADQVQPNVIIILVDDLGVADVSFSSRRLNNGYAAIETPNLDSLAESSQSAQLTNAHTHKVCGPSRAALVTGRLAHNLGNPFPMVEGGSLPAKYKTVGHEFKLRGYTTHFIGKWGIDYPKPSDEVLNRPKPTYEVFNGHEPGMGPTERGFDTFYGLYSAAHNHFTKEVMSTGLVDWHRHNSTHKLDYPDVDNLPEEYSTSIFTREAIDAIRSWSLAEPGFLHLSYTAPHDPLQAPDEYLDRPSCRNMKNWRRRTFCGMVSAIDDGVGEIRRALEERGLAENTIILFSTDNGGAPTVGGFNYPFRGQKGTTYEGGFRTPAFLHVPSDLGAVVRNNLYANTMHIADFSPTLLGLVDRISGDKNRLGSYEALGSDIDGIDHTEYVLRSVGANEFVEQPPPRTSTVLEYDLMFDHAAYLEGEWKLLLGNAGRADRFMEPEGTYFDSSGRPRFVIEEKLCDVIDKGLGPNWFLYGWAMRFMVDAGFKALQPRSGSGRAVAMNRTALQISTMRNNPFNATIAVTADRLPKADFSRYDPSEIQLYNLKNDPFEDENVALDNRKLVEAMVERLQNQVKDDPGHFFAIGKGMEPLMRNLINAMAICLLGFVAIFIVSIRSLRARRAVSETPKTSKPKAAFNLGKKSTAKTIVKELNDSSSLAPYVSKKGGGTVVCTGASSGIGVSCVETFALSGMNVVMCCRSVEAGENVRSSLPAWCQPNVRVQLLDLADLSSVKSAAEQILDTEGTIDVLLNNAGVMAPPKRLETEQGFELQFGVNHVSHHMLTRLLLPALQPGGRVVTVSSIAHNMGKLDFVDLNYDNQRRYSPYGAYGQSKLANVLFAKGLDDRLKAEGSDVLSVSLHPGIIASNLWKYTGPSLLRPILTKLVSNKTVEQGAATSVFASLVEPSVFDGGEYLSDCKVAEPSAVGKDLNGNLRQKLWEATEGMISCAGYELPETLLG